VYNSKFICEDGQELYPGYLSKEQREKISKANRGQRRSEDARRKMSESKQAKATPVLCIETGIIYPCVTAAAVATGTHKSSISNCCKGRLHYNTAGGYHWRWADNKEQGGAINGSL